MLRGPQKSCKRNFCADFGGTLKFTAGFGPEGPTSPYRYTLRRDWRDEAGLFPLPRLDETACFLMLNPSTADAFQNDPTVAKCCRVAQRLGFGAIEVRNIFAYRSTKPDVLKSVDDPIGPENDRAITSCIAHPEITAVVAAWGAHGALLDRSRAVRQMLRAAGKPVLCFALTNLGEPKHPLYQNESNPLLSFSLDLEPQGMRRER